MRAIESFPNRLIRERAPVFSSARGVHEWFQQQVWVTDFSLHSTLSLGGASLCLILLSEVKMSIILSSSLKSIIVGWLGVLMFLDDARATRCHDGHHGLPRGH
jgi:hypothetical protein